MADDGTYRIYDLSAASAGISSHDTSPSSGAGAGEYHQYTLGGEIADVGVIEGQVHEDGFVVLTGSLAFVHVKGWQGGRPATLAASGMNAPPHAWTVISPERSLSRHVEVLASVGDTILSIDDLYCIDQHLAKGPFQHIRPSPGGRFLALTTASQTLWVVSADFSRSMADTDITQLEGNHDASMPTRVEWVGDQAVALAWDDGRVFVLGPDGEGLNYLYSPAPVLVGEMDGLRIISTESCDFIEKVPDASLAVFAPGSRHKAASLVEALESFEQGQPRANDIIRGIKADLAGAVDTCIEAAGLEPDPVWQKKLLRAAMLGRSFLDLYNPTDLVGMAQSLKVLNAIRYYEVGIPLTYQQYLATSPDRLISRLLTRNLHLLALRISTFLNLRPEPVLKHWACAKIAAASVNGAAGGREDDELKRIIVRKYEHEGGKGAGGYADIARRAWQLGRNKLATKLLDHERRPAEQVPLLLSMKEDRLALIKAVDSGDPDLVFHVLQHLRGTKSPGDFFSMVDDGSAKLAPAVKLLQVYGREGDKDLLRDFYYQDDRWLDGALLSIEEAGETDKPQERLALWQNAVKDLAQDKERTFEHRMADDSLRLLTLQEQMERELENKYTFAGLNVNETMSYLLQIGLGKRAEKIRNDWKVPDKRWWYVKLKALTANRDWEGLEAFAKSKKSPIGYEPFVNHLLSVNEPARAAVFVNRCDAKQRVDLYIKCNEWVKAANECKERGDRARLEHLKANAPTTLIQREIDEVLRNMSTKTSSSFFG
ncbi:hypothetical protein QFC20_006597 [Naganishia adeliensis]|uniref:Uncharacterized protein n=1 Tax=Naganishia adeliensis TaxID=92952 RepID=A0ACC2V9X1_9TREE|nr:hypothetical protein QFC20_006597 [Naganishia adeliensis]